jgi:hypothetical protein
MSSVTYKLGGVYTLKWGSKDPKPYYYLVVAKNEKWLDVITLHSNDKHDGAKTQIYHTDLSGLLFEELE